MMKKKEVFFKKAVIFMFGLLIAILFLNNTLNDFEETKSDIKIRLGEKINGGSLTISEYIKLCEKTIGIYLSAAKSGDFSTTYALLTPEYREVINYDQYVESVKEIPFDTARIEEINVLTTNLYKADVVYSGDVVQEYLILLKEKGYSIVPDRFLLHEEEQQKINKKDVVYTLDSYEVYIDQCVFNFVVTNNRKEDVLISKVTMRNEDGVKHSTDTSYTISPGETKKLSVSIDSNIFIPTVFEITRETEEEYMQYRFEL